LGRPSLKITVCGSGRAVTRVPERWTGNWPDNLALARMADDAGIDFLLPIARWKGYGGDTDYEGETLETFTWATGLLASTQRITVFATVHAPLFNPVMAAKALVTADHVGNGRVGLNVVVGWNDDEFAMFGVDQREPAARYRYAQEWIDAVKKMWSRDEDFDFEGEFLRMKDVRAKAETARRCPAVDHECRRLADRPRLCDPQLRRVLYQCIAHLGGRNGENGPGRKG
jgi:FMNH2-dependent dimethyl sulfone monooxygenase